jgi:2-polyprenyl-6-methoxyphenol hydroxylase-like FAD-dependent oxidoreductase
VLADGSDAGREIWRQASRAATSNWGVLWRSLRETAGDLPYADGVTIDAVAPRGQDGATIRFGDGSSEDFDLVVGADGYRSRVREALYPHSTPEYAGYVLWRGNYPEAEAPDREGLDYLDELDAWLTVAFDGGHGVFYPIPDFDGAADGRRRVNWAIYASQPVGCDFTEPSSIPPGAVEAETYAELEALLQEAFPPRYRPLFQSPRDEVSIQPIYDQLADSYVKDRIVLIGDAGTVTRPHTGAGATKAMQDALTLEKLGREHEDWGSILAAYDTDRVETGDLLVKLGRRIGRDQVEHTPPWSEMQPEDLDRWAKGTLSGETLYFQGETEESPAAAATR